MELLVTIIILALIFDYINGFHDAANSIATIVSTRVLTPFQAVLWAAFFNFVAFFIAKYIIGGFGIANTVSKTVVEQYITLPIILAGVIAAITWNLITWWKGIPSSSSHTLIGGFAGAAIMANGFEAIQLNIILKIAAFIFFWLLLLAWSLHSDSLCSYFISAGELILIPQSNGSRDYNLYPPPFFSVGHGLNDSQKVMGIIAAAMIAAHSMGLGMGINSINDLPDWVAFSCFTAISLGTMSGGWKIVKNNGNQNHQSNSTGRSDCRNSRCFHSLHHGNVENSCKYDTYYHRGNHRSRRNKTPFCCSLGSYQKPDDGLILTIPVSGLLAAGVYFIVSLFI